MPPKKTKKDEEPKEEEKKTKKVSKKSEKSDDEEESKKKASKKKAPVVAKKIPKPEVVKADNLNEYEMWCLKNIHQKTVVDEDNFVLWNNPLLLKYKVQEKEIIRALTENTSLVEMKDRKCHNCGNNRFHVTIVQARSADEGATTFFECSQCGKRQSQNA